MKYNSGQKIICEECNEPLEDVVDDYVIAGRIGRESRADNLCPFCDWEFSVEKGKDGRFIVEGI